MSRKHHRNFVEQPSYMAPAASANATATDPYMGATDTTYDPTFNVTSKKPYIGEIVTRSTVWDYYRTSVALPNPSIILQRLGRGVEAYDDLLQDARVKACLNNRRAGTLALKYSIDQNEAPARLYKLIERLFETYDVYTIMSEMLMAPFYGFNITEIIWGKDSGMIVPENIIGKAARWFYWDDTNTLRYRTKRNMTLGEPLPPRKFLVSKYHSRYEDPYSGNESLASACYWPVHFRRLVMGMWAPNFIERYAAPWIDVTMETGLQQERLQEIMDVIQNTFNDGIIAHPENTKIQALPMGDAKSMENYTMFVDMLNREIDMAVLGTNLTTEVKGGSFAATSAHMTVRSDIVMEDSRMIESAFNTLIEYIAYFNFGAQSKLPKFRLYKNEPATVERSTIDVNLQKLGVKFTKEYFTRAYELDDEEFDVGPAPTMQGLPGEPPAEGETGDVGAQDATKIRDAGIENKDPSSNTSTKVAINRAQKKGSPT